MAKNNTLTYGKRSALALFVLICSWALAMHPAFGQEPHRKGILCGDDRVLILEYDPHANRADTVWSWRAAETKGLPPTYLSRLRTMDECKPSATGDTLLLTSSSGAALLLDRRTKEALFYATCPNAHSAEFLPNNRIAVANSVVAGGNSLEIYDASVPERVLFRDTLYSGHGVVWIDSRQRLYALGYDELKVYALVNWESDAPRLRLEKTHTLPDVGGHDLSRVSDRRLLVSTNQSVWTFDADNGTFSEYGPLKGVGHVKSVNYDPRTGQLLYTKGEISWWTHHVHHRNPDLSFHIPGIRVYKARFF